MARSAAYQQLPPFEPLFLDLEPPFLDLLFLDLLFFEPLPPFPQPQLFLPLPPAPYTCPSSDSIKSRIFCSS